MGWSAQVFLVNRGFQMRHSIRFSLHHAGLAIILSATALSTSAVARDCPGNKDALGTSRVVSINTQGGPGFGFQHYKFYDFLKPGEVVLTFDDGFEDVYDNAFPLLRERGIPFVLYLSTLPIETGEPLNLHYPEARPLMWDQINEMIDSGLVTVGAHTHTHPDLRTLACWRELGQMT